MVVEEIPVGTTLRNQRFTVESIHVSHGLACPLLLIFCWRWLGDPHQAATTQRKRCTSGNRRRNLTSVRNASAERAPAVRRRPQKLSLHPQVAGLEGVAQCLVGRPPADGNAERSATVTP